MRLLQRLGFTTASVLALTFSSVPVMAISAHASEVGGSTTTTTSSSGSGDSSTASTDHKATATAKLDAVKLKVCQKRETAINNTLQRIADRGQKQLDLFTGIATKTETFYTTKGKTLSNYDALVSDVNAKKLAAQTTVGTIKADSVTFKCDGTDPKGAAASFKADLKLEISALKAYKTSVKNLIVGVKSVQGSTTSDSNTTTKPTTTTEGSN